VFANILDRWLLQIYGGSIQQGFFGFSFQIGALCFLFAGALTSLLAREFSIAHVKNDPIEMARIFQRYVPILLFITAFLTCFMASQAGVLAHIIGGDKYKDSTWPVFIMMFYPIYQVYGQVCGSIFLSMGETKTYCVIGIIFMLIGIPVTYFLIAPQEFGGLNGGAIGLAIKTIFLQMIGVNVLLYHNAKTLKFSFRKYLFTQIVVIGSLFAVAYFSSHAVHFLFGYLKNVLLKFLLSGLVYTFLIVVIVYFFPSIFDLRRDDIDKIKRIGLFKS
jgi:O-antigen/teichoic acid export membrane protein